MSTSALPDVEPDLGGCGVGLIADRMFSAFMTLRSEYLYLRDDFEADEPAEVG